MRPVFCCSDVRAHSQLPLCTVWGCAHSVYGFPLPYIGFYMLLLCTRKFFFTAHHEGGRYIDVLNHFTDDTFCDPAKN